MNMSSSKLDYLKKYVSKGETLSGMDGGKPKKKKKKKPKVSLGVKGGNLAIVDDDVDWRSLVPQEKPQCSDEEEDPEDRPVVAEVRDETVVKWQPVGISNTSQQSPDRSPDLSPPRLSRQHSPDNKPSRQRQRDGYSSRKRKQLQQKAHRHSSVDVRRQRNDSSDITPPRKVRHDSPDISPPRKIRHDSPDISPPRKTRHDSPDISPPRKTRHDPPDISPPRRVRHDPPDISPPRRARHDPPDISPPRRARHDSPDISPPRRARHDPPDISPPRRARRGQTGPDTDLSPPRRKSRSTDKEPHKSPPRRGTPSAHPTHRPSSPTQITGGKKAGLQSAEVLRQENAAARAKEREMFQNMDATDSGRGAETVYRDKSGRKMNPKLERLKQKQEEKKKLEEEQKFMEWGQGVATLRMAEDKVKDELYEMSKPLARYADDEDLERMLKARERDGDPMLKFIKKKPKLTPSGKQKKERPMFKGSFPANRFGIRPGYRWDGVARSNGFEKAWFARETNKTATADMAYKWSVENM